MAWSDVFRRSRNPEDIAQKWARPLSARNDCRGLAQAFTYRFSEKEREATDGSNVCNAKRALARRLLIAAKPQSVEALLEVLSDADAVTDDLASILCKIDDARALPILSKLQDARTFSAHPGTRDDVFGFIKRHTGVDPVEACFHDWKLTGGGSDRFFLCTICGLNWEVSDEHRRPNRGKSAVDRPNPKEIIAASENGDLAAVQRMLDAGVDPNTRDEEWGFSALHSAAGTGNREIADLLLAKGANVNAADVTGATPLHEAAKRGHLHIAELLLTRGAKVNTRTLTDKMTPLQMTLELNPNEAMEKLLRSHGATGDA